MTAPWTEADVRNQLHALGDVSAAIQQLCRMVAHPAFHTSQLLALASREANMANIEGDIRGDQAHGKGAFQIDVASHADWLHGHVGCKAGTNKPIAGRTALEPGYVPAIVPAAAYALNTVLIPAYGFATRHGVKDVMTFVFAAYNVGAQGAYRGLREHGSPDHWTTGGDYGRDTLRRSQVIHKLLTTRV